ncbi:MAG: phosphotransferase, partial [Pseudomonadota bacterium]
IGDYLEHLLSHWPDHLPYGVCHADLFIDNVFFANDRINGIIDFYFACHDFWAYDLAITLLDWSYKKSPTNVSFNIENACQLIAGYNSLRPLQKDEYRYLKLLCSGAAMRFLLTRAYDWIHTPKDALVKPKNPLEYLHIIRHLHQQKFFIELE